MSFATRQPEIPTVAGVPVTAAALRADVVICTYTLARWELFARSVESVLAQNIAPQRLVIVVDHNDELLAQCQQEWGAGQRRLVRRDRHCREPVPGQAGFVAKHRAAARSALRSSPSSTTTPKRHRTGSSGCSPCTPRTREPSRSAVRHGRTTGRRGRPGSRPISIGSSAAITNRCPNRLAPVRRLIGTSMSVRRDADARLSAGSMPTTTTTWTSRIGSPTRTGRPPSCYEPRAEVRHYVPPERLTWSYYWRRCFFVNRNKVGAFADMGEAGNIRAELRFGAGVLLTLSPALLAAVTGRPERLRQALAAVLGLALGGCGFVAGRAQLARGRRAGGSDHRAQRSRHRARPRAVPLRRR